MTGRLLLDEMYPASLAEALRSRGHDAAAVVERSDLVGRRDPRVLTAAAEDERCLFTENVRDFAVLAREMPHAGVLLANAGRWPRSPGGIARIAVAIDRRIAEGRLPGTGEVDWLS